MNLKSLMMHLRQLLYIAVLFSLFACGTKQQQTDDSIFLANIYLSKSECDKALTELTKIDPEYYDYFYYQVLASAKACQGNFKVLDIVNDLDDYDSSANFFNFLAGLTPSNETSASAVGFTALEDGINSILYLNSTTKAQFSHRLDIISNRAQAEDLSFQALLMILVYLGKWFAYFGDADAAGTKSLGSLDVNNCLIDYDAAASQLNGAERTALLGNSGTCNASIAATGSAQLVFGSNSTRDRLCKVIVYFNHISDITSNITLSSNQSLGDIAAAFDSIETYVTSAETAFPGISSVLTFYSLSSCTAYYDASVANQKNIHAYIAGVVEKNFL